MTIYAICSAGPSTSNNGNLQGYDEYIGGPGNSTAASFASPTFTQSGISYDGVNRLTSITDSGGWSRSFEYDQWGNMSVVSATGPSLNINTPVATTATIYNANNQRSDAGQGYDPAGNVNAMINFSNLTYDAEDRLLTASAPTPYTYAYDGNGRRVMKTGAGNTTVYIYDVAGRLAAEYDAVLGDQPCATCYLTEDYLGSVRLVTDSAGNVISRHDFLPFGEEVPQGQAGRSASLVFGDSDNVTQRFTAKERDAESGLDYFGARYYGSALGRFTSPDEFKGGFDDLDGKPAFAAGPLPYADLSDPQTLNKYLYVRNNPLRYTDPNGHCIEDLCIGEGALVYAGYTALAGATAAYLASPSGQQALHAGAQLIQSAADGLHNLITKASAENQPPPTPGTAQGGAQPTSPPTAGATTNTNPYAGPVSGPVTVVDPKGNAIPVNTGEQVQGSKDGRYVQVKDANGNPTGVRIDGGHPAAGHSDPRAQQPHGHVPGKTNPDGTPWLPINQ
jgi:RHS repeat-associated protein